MDDTYCKLLLNGIHSDASIEEIDRYLVMLFEVIERLDIYISGFIKDENGVFVVAPASVINMLRNLGTPDYKSFDFLEYVKTTDQNDLWLTDYQNGPRLLRYHR